MPDWKVDPEAIQATLAKSDLHTLVALLSADDTTAVYRVIVYGANKHALLWLHARIDAAFDHHVGIQTRITSTGIGIFTVTETKEEEEPL